MKYGVKMQMTGIAHILRTEKDLCNRPSAKKYKLQLLIKEKDVRTRTSVFKCY